MGAVIARGGMGVVLNAEDIRLCRRVAMKRMLASGAAESENLRRFVREAQVLGWLEHPNIVPIHDLGLDEGGEAFYTMKFVQGRTLQSVLSSIAQGNREDIADYPLSRLLTIFLKVCDGVAFAHSKGIIHRDLKPANIMLGEYGEVLVMDWGLAKILSAAEEEAPPSHSPATGLLQAAPTAELTMPGEVMGTPTFMAPEQASGRVAEQDQRTDIFALGGILYTILTLNTPVKGDSVEELLGNIQNGYIPPPVYYNHAREIEVNGQMQVAQPNLPHCPGGQVPESLSAVAMKALSVKREDRYQLASELRREVELFLEGRSVTVQPDSLAQAFWKLIKRNQGVSITIFAAAIILLGMGILFTYDNAKKRRAAETARDNQRRTALSASERFARQAVLAAENSRWEEAQQHVADAFAVCPDGPWEAYAQGRLAQIKGDHQTAIKLFGQALKVEPAQAEIKSALAKSVSMFEQIAAARETLTNVSKLEGWQALEAMGNTLAEAKNWREAERAYAQCLLAVGTNASRSAVENKLKEVRAWIACEGFYESIRDLPATEQVRRVEQKLSEIHGEPKRIDGKNGRLIEGGIWRVAGLGIWNTNCTLIVHLQPLFGMPLTELDLTKQKVRDISPLRGMPLQVLSLSGCNKVRDISPLKGMPLTVLNIGLCDVTNLGPLHGMPLRILNCNRNGSIKDLAPLAGMPLEELNCDSTQVGDLSPLKGMPLKRLDCSGTYIGDLRPLIGMPLKKLWIAGTYVSDLRPLAGMQLTTLNCTRTAVSDLAALKGMPLTELYCDETKVTDLTPLEGMRLESFSFSSKNIKTGLELVRGMKSLKRISENRGNNWMTAEEFWKAYDARKKPANTK